MTTRAHLTAISFAGVPDRPRRSALRKVRTPLHRFSVVRQTAKPALISWLFQQAGFDARHYRGRPLERRLYACLRALRVHGEDEARELVSEQPELVHFAIDALLLGVTGFFRDPGVFHALGGILADKKPDVPLRIWSVGCSDGAELYSVAMLIAERGVFAHCEAVGTDCRPDAIRKASIGTYSPTDLELVPSSVRDRYFEPTGDGLRVRPMIRNAIRWTVHNFLNGVLPGPWDVILWRNSAIYLEPESSQAVAAGLVRELRPGGLLVVGRAERLDTQPSLSRIARCIYRKSGE